MGAACTSNRRLHHPVAWSNKRQRLLLTLAAATVPLLQAQTTFGAAVAKWWDTNGASTGAGGSGSPSGTWSTSATNWSTSSGGTSATAGWVNDSTGAWKARFSAASDGTGAFAVTLPAEIQIAQIGLEEGTPTFTGGTLTFVGAEATQILTGITVGVPTIATFDSKLSGSIGIDISRSSASGNVVTFTNTANDFSGVLAVNSGNTLKVAAAGALSANSTNLTLNDATLQTTASFSLAKAIVLGGSSGGGLLVDSGTTLTFAGANSSQIISGSGDLIKTGAGTLILGNQTNQNQYSGNTIISGGMLSYVANGSGSQTAGLPLAPTSFTANYWTIQSGATMQLNVSSSGTTGFGSANRGITIGTGGGIVDVSGTNSIILNAPINGSNSFTKSGTGTLTVSGSGSTRDTASATTAVNSGTLKLTNATALYTNGTTNSKGAVSVGANAVFELAGVDWSAGGNAIPVVNLTDNGATLRGTGTAKFTKSTGIVVTSGKSVKIQTLASGDSLAIGNGIGGPTSDTGTTVTFDGPGSVSLSGSSSAFFTTDITGGGKVLINSTGSSTGPLGNLSNTLRVSSGTLGFNSVNGLSYPLSLNGGTIAAGTADRLLTGAITLQNGTVSSVSTLR